VTAVSRHDDGSDGGRPDRLLTVPELAARWGVHQRTIRRMIKGKKIKVIRLGRSIRVHPKCRRAWPRRHDLGMAKSSRYYFGVLMKYIDTSEL
jgi:excisionase family DNA binding protein